jgi:hypothetical protein
VARVLPVAHPTAPSAWTVVPKAATGTLRKVTPVLASGVPQPASGFDALVFAFQDYDPTEVCVCACVCAGLNAMGDCVAQVRWCACVRGLQCNGRLCGSGSLPMDFT